MIRRQIGVCRDLEALEYQLGESAPRDRKRLSMLPSEYFRRQFYGCFWFETVALTHLLDWIGPQSVMFETDFPHATCLYPKPLDRVRETLSGLEPAVLKQILQDNAVELYNIPLP